jgi:hypothetical protein
MKLMRHVKGHRCLPIMSSFYVRRKKHIKIVHSTELNVHKLFISGCIRFGPAVPYFYNRLGYLETLYWLQKYFGVE